MRHRICTDRLLWAVRSAISQQTAGLLVYILQQYFGIQFFCMSLDYNCENSAVFLQFSRDPVNGVTTFFHASVELFGTSQHDLYVFVGLCVKMQCNSCVA